jgi:hypothetical protein
VREGGREGGRMGGFTPQHLPPASPAAYRAQTVELHAAPPTPHRGRRSRRETCEVGWKTEQRQRTVCRRTLARPRRRRTCGQRAIARPAARTTRMAHQRTALHHAIHKMTASQPRMTLSLLGGEVMVKAKAVENLERESHGRLRVLELILRSEGLALCA